MANQLIESILNKDFVTASQLFESHMQEIVEKKLHEEKRHIASLNEIVKPVKGKPGEFTGQNTPKDWAKYRKAHPALGMYDTPGGGKVKKPENKVEKLRKAGYVKAEPALKALEFIKRVRKYKETGKLDEKIEGTPGKFQRRFIDPELSNLDRAKHFQQKKDKLIPDVPAGTQKGFTAPLSRTPPGSQRGFTAPLKSEPKTSTASGVEPKKPWTVRNKNTLLGRDPDYDSKNQSRGGRAGTAARGAISTVLGAIAQAGE